MGEHAYDDGSLIGSINAQDFFRRQVDRCARSASIDYEAFSRNVEVLALLLPTRSLTEFDEMKEDYTETREKWTYTYNCGIKVGSVEHPCYSNAPGNVGYNSKRPTVLVSPIRTEEEETDYFMMLRIILRLAESAGISWDKEQTDNIRKKSVRRES